MVARLQDKWPIAGFDVTMSSCGRVLRKVNTAILSILPRYLKWPNGEIIFFFSMFLLVIIKL